MQRPSTRWACGRRCSQVRLGVVQGPRVAPPVLAPCPACGWSGGLERAPPCERMRHEREGGPTTPIATHSVPWREGWRAPRKAWSTLRPAAFAVRALDAPACGGIGCSPSRGRCAREREGVKAPRTGEEAGRRDGRRSTSAAQLVDRSTRWCHVDRSASKQLRKQAPSQANLFCTGERTRPQGRERQEVGSVTQVISLVMELARALAFSEFIVRES